VWSVLRQRLITSLLLWLEELELLQPLVLLEPLLLELLQLHIQRWFRNRRMSWLLHSHRKSWLLHSRHMLA
jgi:hypothetical protein